jgi:hypothetical protein
VDNVAYCMTNMNFRSMSCFVMQKQRSEMQVIERALSVADTFDEDYVATSTHPDSKQENETALKPFDVTKPSATVWCSNEVKVLRYFT